MVFVDATKYLKVQDDDLENAFDDHSSRGGEDDKYAKASFESFQIDPTDLPSNREPFRWSMFSEMYDRIPKLVWIFVPMLIFIVALVVVVVVVTYNLDGAGPPEDDDKIDDAVAVVAGVSRRAAVLLPRLVRDLRSSTT